MTVREHIYPLPDEAQLDQMIGAATPHFALQIRDRVAEWLEALPSDDPRRPELTAQIARLEVLAVDGEAGRAGQAELPPRPSLDLDQPTV